MTRSSATTDNFEYEEALRQASKKNRLAVLRVYNYYRVGLSFALFLLFLQVEGQQLVGKFRPDLFQIIILAYLFFNIVQSFYTLLAKATVVDRIPFILAVLIIDIVMLSGLMYTSGGIVSGLGNFLVFPVAFSGVLLKERLSLLIPSVAAILALYCEMNLYLSAHSNGAAFFKLGLLGGVFYCVNLLFQYVSRQLRKKEQEVVSLEQINELQKTAEKALKELNETNGRFRLFLNSAGEGVLVLDRDGVINYANPKACSLLEIEDPVGKSMKDVIDEDLLREQSDITALRGSGGLHEIRLDKGQGGQHTKEKDVISYLFQHVRGSSIISPIWSTFRGRTFNVEYTWEETRDEQNDFSGVVIIFQDVSSRKETEDRLQYLANYDTLTGLSNRGFFQVEIEKAFARSKRNNGSMAIMLLDLDHFKFINDKYGHDIGDELLIEVARRIGKCIRKGDTAARLGGDEFAIMLLDFNSAENVEFVSRNILDEISNPFELNDHYLNVSTSIGVCLFDQKRESTAEMLKFADIAMYESKARGRNSYTLFEPDMQKNMEAKQRLVMALHQAIQRNEFKLNYQPIYSLTDGSIVSSEALIRWKLDTGESIGPDTFIPIAEKNGRIDDIGDWVLRTVFEQISMWYEKLDIYPRVAINVSARQLRTDHFREQLEKLLKSYSIPAEVIHLELLETGVMEDAERSLYELSQLHKLGIRLAIDDFGTGYSSLDFLRRLPIDVIKVDKSFVHGIGVNKYDEEIVRVIIAMAQTMGIKAVAEGVESNDQLEFLKSCGCHMAQGYLFSREKDPFEFTDLLKQNLEIVVDGRQAWQPETKVLIQ